MKLPLTASSPRDPAARLRRRLVTRAAGLLLAALLTRTDASEPPTEIFAYDRTASLDVHEIGRQAKAGAIIRDITFASAGADVRASIVCPARPTGKSAGILYVHWLGDPETTNRTEFLEEATALAARGAVSVLVDTMWAAPKWYGQRIPEEDFDHAVRQVIELRRAMDLLLQQAEVDPARIALVGHDFGAMYGMIAESLDRRARTCVFMAPTPHFIDWFLFARQPQDLPAYRERIASIDPVRYLPKIAPARVFFQFANRDEYVDAAEAAELYAAAGAPKHQATYPAGHDLHTPEVAADRVAWLVRELSLDR